MKRNLLLLSIIFAASSFFTVPELIAQSGKTPKQVANVFEPAIPVSRIFDEQDLRKMMREDGLTEPVINRIIEERKKMEAQGRKVAWTSHKKSGGNPVPMASCNDIGVENGWGNWLGATGTNSGGNPGTFNPPAVPATPRFDITGIGFDPCTPGLNIGDPQIPTVCPGFGNASIQLGEPQTTGCMTEQLTYPLSVTPADTIFVYSYALVMFDPASGHAPQEKPFADFVILDQNGDTVPCSYVHYVSNSNIPGWYIANANCMGSPSTYYKPWTTTGVNLKNYVGQNLTVVITNGDCTQCGHYAHSYWDFMCGSIPIGGCTGGLTTVCGPDSDPSSPYAYQWYRNGNIILGATNKCQGVTPNSGDTYMVKVMQASGCDFYMSYLAANGGVQALFTYNKNGSVVTFTDLSTAANQWNWNFGDGQTATTQNPMHTYTANGTFNACLIVSDGACTDTVCKTFTIGATDVAEVDIAKVISIFPSPASKNLYLDFNGENLGNSEVSISNLIGENIFERKILAAGRQMLDVSGFSEGIYFVRINTDLGTVTKKIVVSR